MSDCPCCQPAWSLSTVSFEPCGYTQAGYEYDVPCGFTIDYYGINGGSTGELYPYWSGIATHRNITEWRSTVFDVRDSGWMMFEKPSPVGWDPYGDRVWNPVGYMFVLKPYNSVPTPVLDWTLSLHSVTVGAIPGYQIASWKLSNWDPYSTKTTASFPIFDDPDNAMLPDIRIANWHIFTPSLTKSDIQNEAIEQKIICSYFHNGTSWVLQRGDQGNFGGPGSTVTVNPSQPLASFNHPVSNYYNGFAPTSGMPFTVDVTPTCFQSTDPVLNQVTPCYDDLRSWITGRIDVQICETGVSNWRITGFDNLTYGPPCTITQFGSFWDFYHFWDSQMNFTSVGLYAKIQIASFGQWYLLVNPAASFGVQPGTNTNVWRQYGGNHIPGAFYNYEDWVLNTADDYVYMVSNVAGTSTTPPGSDWTPLGPRLQLVTNTSDTCDPPCVSEVYSPAGYNIIPSTVFPPAQNDEPDLDCVEIVEVPPVP